MHATLEEKAELLERYAGVTARHGHDPDAVRHASTHLACVADNDRAAEQAIRKALPDLVAATRDYVRLDGATASRRQPDQYVDHLLDIHPVGGPRRCREAVAAAAALPGVGHLLLMVEGAGGRERTIQNIAGLAADVLELGPPSADAKRRNTSLPYAGEYSSGG